IVRVAGSSRISISGNRTEVGPGKNVFLHSRDREVSSRNFSERTGLDIEQAGRPSMRLSCNLAAGPNGDDFAVRRQADVAAEEKSKLRSRTASGSVVKYSGAFHKKLTRLGEINGEAREIQNLRVQVGLGKIGVGCEIGREVGRDSVFHVFNPDIGMDVRLQ